MTTIESTSTGWDGRSKPFWGLVQQDGPWSRTKSDIARAKMNDKPNTGGGVGAGGRQHAGNANWSQTMTPYKIDATGAPPKPSDYAMRSVMMFGIDMKRQSKFRRNMTGMKLGERRSLLAGANSGPVMNYAEVAPDLKPDVLLESESGAFITTHGIEERSSPNTPTILHPGMEIDDPNNFYGSVIEESMHTIPYTPPHYTNQMAASQDAVYAERIATMAKRRGSFQLGPETVKSVRSKEPSAERKRRGSFQHGPETIKSVRTKEPSAERKRRGSFQHGPETIKSVRTKEPSAERKRKGSFQHGPETIKSVRTKEPIAERKRKGDFLMSDKFKKSHVSKKEKPPRISTVGLRTPLGGETMVGRVKGVRAENKSAPGKESNIPHMKRRK